MEKLSNYILTYKQQLAIGDVQKAYVALVKYVMKLKSHLSKTLSDEFSFGNIFQGYMDYTYFYFTDKHLRDHKLRYGVVLNHEKMQFELWLLGQNAEVQNKYWKLLKSTKWNEGRSEMPQYSVLKIILVDNPDLNDLDSLTLRIEKEVITFTAEITQYLKQTIR